MKTNDKRQQMILDNMKLVHYWVWKLGIFPNSDEYDEMFQSGILGLIMAVDSFDESKGNKFSTYASRCIKNSIFIENRIEKREQKKIAASLQDIVLTSKDDNESTFEDIIEDKTVNIEDMVTDNERFEEMVNILLNYLKPNALEVIFYRISGYQLMDIVKNMEITRSRINDMEMRIRRKFPKVLKNHNNYIKIFSISDDNKKYEFRFQFSKEVDLKKIKTELDGIHFDRTIPKIKINDEQIEIILPKDIETLSSISQVLGKLEELGIKYIKV